MNNIKVSNYEIAHKRRLRPAYGSMPKDSKNTYGINKQESENNRGYNVNFSGSTQTESVTAAKSLMERIMNTKAFHMLTGFSGAHNVAAAALIGLFLAGGLRPAITYSLPGEKDREDKIYAAGHSMASGLIGFAFSTLITTPIDSGIKYIYDDAKKISKEDYNKLSVEELAEYIRKNNFTAEDIAKKMKNNSLSESEILSHLKDTEGNNLKSLEIAEYVKANNGEIMPIRKFSNNFFKIVSSKTDQINKLKRELRATTDMVEQGKILGIIRDIENWVKGIDTTTKNIAEWVIAVPRAMLTIALIPPILKYVFHVEKKKKQQVKPQPQPTANAENLKQNVNVEIKTKSIQEFIGGTK